MKPRATALAVITMAAALSVGVCPHDGQMAPPPGGDGGRRPYVAHLSADLGEVRAVDLAGETVTHRWTYANTSTYPVTLVPGAKSCTCASVHVSPPTLLPGERAAIELAVDVSQRTGQVRANAEIRLLERDEALGLDLQVVIRRACEWSPARLELSGEAGVPAEGAVEIRCEEPSEILAIEHRGDVAEVAATSSADGRRWTLQVRSIKAKGDGATNELGRGSVTCLVKSVGGMRSERQVEIPVEIRTIPALRVAPRIVSIRPGHVALTTLSRWSRRQGQAADSTVEAADLPVGVSLHVLRVDSERGVAYLQLRADRPLGGAVVCHLTAWGGAAALTLVPGHE